MEDILSYVKPELLVVALVLYFSGNALKTISSVKDKYIPLILGAFGIVLCAAWVFARCTCEGPREFLMALFTSVTQGVLVAGLSTYVHQILTQLQKKE